MERSFQEPRSYSTETNRHGYNDPLDYPGRNKKVSWVSSHDFPQAVAL